MQKRAMEFTLEKLIADIKIERCLWAADAVSSPDETLHKWDNIASKNKLTGTEARSIFKVLCKKYKQEAVKPTTTWKLFQHLKFLDEADKPLKEEIDDASYETNSESAVEEETYVELLEVKDEEFSDDEYNRHFDGKEEVNVPAKIVHKVKEKEKVQSEIKPKPEQNANTKVDNVSVEEDKTEKKPVAENAVQSALQHAVQNHSKEKLLKRKNSEKSDHGLPEKKILSAKSLLLAKNLQNGVVKNILDADSETESNGVPGKFSNFGRYVDSTLTRLPQRLAAKLEIKILQSIIDVSSEMMDKLE